MALQAHWSDEDLEVLIAFLVSKKAAAGDGLSFKDAIWTEAAQEVNNKSPPLRGAPKTAGSCKSKLHKLKQIFNIVSDIKAQSGFKWDEERGADIDDTTAEVWAAYEKRHKGASPFRNKGWVWYNKLVPIMPNAPRGAHVFHASTQSQQFVNENEGGEISDDELEKPLSGWGSPSPPPSASLITSQNVVIPAKRRESALSSDTEFSVSYSAKRSRSHGSERPSGAMALHGMNSRLDEFTDVFREAFVGKRGGVEATPSRKTRAMKRVQQLETQLSNSRKAQIGRIQLLYIVPYMPL
ncbi:hypothetical protein JR316_0008615 [Psilocybe cubensis]|uniref:Uncharacterized protein n=2 Tax=Psilocybe cubensis TaxID=181762 RepID=A0ACB8GRV8_PSICU|nr:hypothetical protein JR316_0008615 [Psilocybe cubensis]KAH9478162.1 hypothetical protein JR316_0008615 [Psilocybe cubensis]